MGSFLQNAGSGTGPAICHEADNEPRGAIPSPRILRRSSTDVSVSPIKVNDFVERMTIHARKSTISESRRCVIQREMRTRSRTGQGARGRYWTVVTKVV